MRCWLAAAVLLCLSAAPVLAADPWIATASAPASLRDHPLSESQIVPITPDARAAALDLLARHRVVRLDAADYARLTGRSDGSDHGLRPYLVRAAGRDDGLGSNHVFAAAGHVLVEYNGPLVNAATGHAALVLLLPFALKLHIAFLLYG